MFRSALEARPKDDAGYSDPQQGGYVYPADEGGGASLAAREVQLQVGANATGTWDLGKVFQILSGTAPVLGRLRLYRSAAARAADATRPLAVDYTPESGVQAEGAWPSGGGTIDNPLPACTAGPEGLTYWAWDGPATALTLRVLTLEA